MQERAAAVPADPGRAKAETELLEKEAEDAAKSANARKALAFFDQKKLQRLLRHPHRQSDKTVELQLAGEFFRSDGVQAQFLCGTPQRIKRDRT